MSSTNIYCTYLTIYKGIKLPPFYIGSSTVKNVESGYRGSVASKKYKAIWRKELKEHPELFKTKIISLHETGEKARAKELKFQRALNVVHSPLYINQSYAKVNGYFGVIRKGKDSPSYGKSPNEEARKKLSEARSGKNNPGYGKTGENNPKSINFWAIDPDGVKYIAKGIIQFARLHNLNATNIVNVLKGRYTQHKNWKFGYIEEYDLVKVVKKEPRNRTGKNNSNFNHSIYKFFNTETQEMFVGHRYDFIRKYDLSNVGVCSLISNKQKYHRKWILIEKLI